MPDQRPVLVIGGTGMLGRPVVDALVAAGSAVRVMTRSGSARFAPGVEVVAGAVEDEPSLAHALAGCRAVHVNLRGATAADMERVELGGTKAVVAAAKTAGVERIGYLSGAGIEAADPALVPARVKQGAEAAVRASGIRWTLFRATHFMESLDLFARGRHAELMTPQPLRYHYIAAADYGRQVARAYDTPAAADRAFSMFGPEGFTMREALDVYIARARPDLKLRTTPTRVLRIVAAVTRNTELKHAAMLFAAFPRIGETGDGGETDALLGPATTTLTQWCSARATRSAA